MLDFWKNTQEEETMSKSNPTPQERYEKANIKKMTFAFNLKTDADILKKLNSVPNKLGYLKAVIRADMAKTTDVSRKKSEIVEKLRGIESKLDGLDL